MVVSTAGDSAGQQRLDFATAQITPNLPSLCGLLAQHGSVTTMWSSVLGLALMGLLNPVRLGVILLLISRQKPAQNLFVFWVGCLTISTLMIIGALTILHFTPVLDNFSRGLSTSASKSGVGHFQVGLGVFALSIALLMTLRRRSRPGGDRSAEGGGESTVEAGSRSRNAFSKSGSTDTGTVETTKSAIRRVAERVRNAWGSEALWPAFVVGLGMGPSPEIILLVLATIATSGAAFITQLAVAAAYIVLVLGVVEVVLISHRVAPAQTEAVLRRLHGWALAHREQVLIVIFIVVGLSWVVRGLGLA